MMQIGVIGCGLMGQGIITNLLQANYEVTIYDVNEAATLPLVEKGAVRAQDVSSLAGNVDVLLLSLPSPNIIQDILLKEAFPVMREGTFVLDVSTNDVEITRQLAKKAKCNDITYFDCPLSGGPSGAHDGTLTIMVGGDQKKFPTMLPILEAIGKKIEYIGESGAGQIVKLCNNMVVGGIIGLVGEALKTGEAMGVKKERIAELMQKGSAQTKVMDVFGPSIITEQFHDVTFSLNNMLKDVRLYEEMAENISVSTDISKAVQQLYELAFEADKGDKDATVIYEIV